MISPREFLFGPWRAVPVLGITQILAWGTIFYTPVLMLPLIAAERGFSLTFAMGGFSVGLLAAGLVSPYVGRLIDRYGGHRVMPFGSLGGALGLAALVYASHPAAYLAVWILLGAALAASLYDPAFATLGRIFGAKARSPITALTLMGGFASTASWPATFVLLQSVGWKTTYLIYAAALALVAAPLHAFALPRMRAETHIKPVDGAPAPPPTRPAAGAAFLLVIAAFASYAFVPSGLSAHLLAIFQRAGIEPGTVVLIGALFGPAQVAARLCEFIFARNVHPLLMARFAVGLLVASFVLLGLSGFSTPVAVVFAIMFGVANGLITIARGAVPLALFGAAGYGGIVGRIAGPSLIVTAVAPVVIAFVAERASDPVALAVATAFAALAFVCFLAIRR
jgi:MFS family permease